MPTKFIDPYIDTKYDVLRNLVAATSYDELANAEGEYVSSRTAELLSKNLPKLTGTLEDFKFLHHAIFKDIFDWAGQILRPLINDPKRGTLPYRKVPLASNIFC